MRGVSRSVLRIRRKRSRGEQLIQRGRDVIDAAMTRDAKWARSKPARFVREAFLSMVLSPLMDIYTRRRSTGRERLDLLKGPVILVANHTSHIDTPVILAALPRKLRQRTAVAAAADYFYRNRVVSALVSLVFNTVPIDRTGRGKAGVASNLDKILTSGWNLLVYPEGTRKNGGRGRVRRGAAVLAQRHNLPIVPIRVSGTSAAMPPGRVWPRRIRQRLISRRHKIDIAFGDPIPPDTEPGLLLELVQRFFDGVSSDDPPSPNGTNGTKHANGSAPAAGKSNVAH